MNQFQWDDYVEHCDELYLKIGIGSEETTDLLEELQLTIRAVSKRTPEFTLEYTITSQHYLEKCRLRILI